MTIYRELFLWVLISFYVFSRAGIWWALGVYFIGGIAWSAIVLYYYMYEENHE